MFLVFPFDKHEFSGFGTAPQRSSIAFLLRTLIDRVSTCHDRAVRRLIAAEADRYYHNTLTDHYRVEASKVNPTTDWWGYAHLRDKQQEQEQEFELAFAHALKCTRRVSHLREQLAALRTKQLVG